MAKGTDIGVYPTISYTPAWAHGDGPGQLADGEPARRRHRDEICKEALKCYEEGADGVSLFNWFRAPLSAADEEPANCRLPAELAEGLVENLLPAGLGLQLGANGGHAEVV